MRWHGRWAGVLHPHIAISLQHRASHRSTLLSSRARARLLLRCLGRRFRLLVGKNCMHELHAHCMHISGLLSNCMHISRLLSNCMHISGLLSNCMHISGLLSNCMHISGLLSTMSPGYSKGCNLRVAVFCATRQRAPRRDAAATIHSHTTRRVGSEPKVCVASAIAPEVFAAKGSFLMSWKAVGLYF